MSGCEHGERNGGGNVGTLNGGDGGRESISGRKSRNEKINRFGCYMVNEHKGVRDVSVNKGGPPVLYSNPPRWWGICCDVNDKIVNRGNE